MNSLRQLQLESLEERQLLSSDGILPDPQALIALGGIVSGTKWEDTNANGTRQDNEPGLAGVTIYADTNHNGELDQFEASTTTAKDNPNTKVDETGQYELFLFEGSHVIREIEPKGFVQTYPGPSERPFFDPDIVLSDEFASVEPSFLGISGQGEPIQTEIAVTVHPTCFRPMELDIVVLDEAGGMGDVDGVELVNHSGVQLNGCGGESTVFGLDLFVHNPDIGSFQIGFFDIVGGDVIATMPVSVDGSTSGGHQVEIRNGGRIDGLDFGNARIQSNAGSIEGRKWLDTNGNGKQDGNEVGLGGVPVFLDANNNGRLDRGERTTHTQFEDPFTDFDEGGLYSFGGLRAGEYVVREVVPFGYAQTFPTIQADVVSSETGVFTRHIAHDFDITDVSFDQSGKNTKTDLELSVQWPNGCGEIDADQTSHAVIGNTIVVDAHGYQTGEICTEALKTTTMNVTVPGLSAGNYNVIGTLHEDGANATLAVSGEIEVGTSGAHRVEVATGQVASGVDFGNRRTGPAESVQGTKWNDVNGDGVRQRGEAGLGGITIYVDANSNREFDKDELSTVTSSDADNLGAYKLELTTGYHQIREVVPEGYQQTFPMWDWAFEPVDLPFDPLFPFPGGGTHFVEIFPGDQIEGVDFGNQSAKPGSVSGVKWNDVNGDGIRGEDEAGLGGVTIYVDTNFSGAYEEGEPNAVSDDAGRYTIDGVRPGNYAVREIVPDGYRQTFPYRGDWWFVEEPIDGIPIDVEIPLDIDQPFEQEPRFDEFENLIEIGRFDELRIAPPFQNHFVIILPGEAVDGIDFGNQELKPGSISGLKWQDENGNGVREPSEVALAGVTIFIDSNHNGNLDENELSTVTAKDDLATPDDETGRYRFDDLKPLNSYSLQEVIPDGYEQTFPARFDWIGMPVLKDPFIVGDIFPFPRGAHHVYVDSGQDVEQINFGNRKIVDPGFVSGTKWEDIDKDGKRGDNEPGLPDVTIFADVNLNGQLDRAEPYTVTERDNPDTDIDESGQYTLKVRPGSWLILEAEQLPFQQTYPNPARKLAHPFNLGHFEDVVSGGTVEGIDFGNHRRTDLPGGISGNAWFDFNANGVQDRGEEPIPGVTVYLDQNDNSKLDDNEVSTVSGYLFDDLILPGDSPIPPFQLNGHYSFDVEPGDYVVRQVIPESFIQTHPSGAFELGETVSASVDPKLVTSFDLVDVTTTSTSANDSGQADTLITLSSTWSANEVEVFDHTVRVEGNTIVVELLGIGFDIDSDVQMEHLTTVNIGSLEFGDYELKATLGEFTEPDIPVEDEATSAFELKANFSLAGEDAYRVSVGSGEYLSGFNFGRIAVPFIQPRPDSHMGEDPHSGNHDKTATSIEFLDGHLNVNSYIDADNDSDVFRFIGNGHPIHGEGGLINGSAELAYELLDQDGQQIAAARAGEPLIAETDEGNAYYLRVSGGVGQYQLDLFEQTREEGTASLPGDTDSDGDVDFTDFLVLTSKFGQEVDAAFADADFDGDGEIGFADFLVLSANFGRTI